MMDERVVLLLMGNRYMSGETVVHSFVFIL